MQSNTLSQLAQRALAGAAAASMALALAACGGTPAPSADGGQGGTGQAAEKTQIVVFGAASLTESLTKAGEEFMAEHPEYEVSFNFDSSGTLKTQIQEGADCDVFISAGQKQMDQLDSAASADVNTEGLDLVDSQSRFDILENKVTLVVPEGNPKGIESLDQLAELLASGDVLLAMGNSDVPVGQYTQKILAHYGLDEEALAAAGVLTYGSNVKEVTTQVSEGAVDCGIIYQTDAHSAGLSVVDYATAEMCGQVVYPAAATKNAPNPEGAAAFLEFLKGEQASSAFAEVGFTPLAAK